MAQARQLLIGSDDTIEWVAGRVGFESAPHFHRTFRRVHGSSPGAWRRQHRERLVERGATAEQPPLRAGARHTKMRPNEHSRS